MCRSWLTISMPQPCLCLILGDQVIELGLADEVDGLHRLVQHQQIRLAQAARGPAVPAAISPPDSEATVAVFQMRDAGLRQRHVDLGISGAKVSDSNRFTSSGTLGPSGKRCGT